VAPEFLEIFFTLDLKYRVPVCNHYLPQYFQIWQDCTFKQVMTNPKFLAPLNLIWHCIVYTDEIFALICQFFY